MSFFENCFTDTQQYRIRVLCADGSIRSVRCGRRILVNLDSLAAYLNGTDTPAAAEAEGVRRVN